MHNIIIALILLIAALTRFAMSSDSHTGSQAAPTHQSAPAGGTAKPSPVSPDTFPTNAKKSHLMSYA